MGVNKLHIMACVHKRQAETKMFVKHFNYLAENAQKELGLTLVCSTDKDYKYLVEELGVSESCVFKHVNKPLSRKHNLMLEQAMREDWDGLIHLGSDDLVSLAYLKAVENLNLVEPRFYALTDIYFTELKSGKNKRFKSNKIGAGRVFSRRLIERECRAVKVVFNRPYYAHQRGEEAYIPFALKEKIVHERRAAEEIDGVDGKYILWFAKKDNGLDNESNRVLLEAGYEPVPLNFKAPQLIDVKGPDSLTSWYQIKTNVLNHEFHRQELNRISPVNFQKPKSDET